MFHRSLKPIHRTGHVHLACLVIYVYLYVYSIAYIYIHTYNLIPTLLKNPQVSLQDLKHLVKTVHKTLKRSVLGLQISFAIDG